MFPYKDENPTVLTPVVTIGLIAVTTAIWILYQGGGVEPKLTQSVCGLGAIPGRLFGETLQALGPKGAMGICPGAAEDAWYTLATSIFLHGGWFHLIGNMWFLWVFGNNIEDAMGPKRFILFYLVTGVIAAMSHAVVDTASPIPMVGASGAISGVMGAYLVLYPKVRVHTLVVLGFFITRITLPAYFMLLYWAFIQFLGSVPSLAGADTGGGVAFMAHLGGFVAGAVLIKVFVKPDLLAQARRKPFAFSSSQPWR